MSDEVEALLEEDWADKWGTMPEAPGLVMAEPHGWTHAICTTCWNIARPDAPIANAGDERYHRGDLEQCCYCGAQTRSGIWYRGALDGTKTPEHCSTP